MMSANKDDSNRSAAGHVAGDIRTGIPGNATSRSVTRSDAVVSATRQTGTPAKAASGAVNAPAAVLNPAAADRWAGIALPAPPAGTLEAFSRLYGIIARLRGPGGCPWDIEQSPASLRETLIEESYETVEAITDGDTPHVREELGDVFLNVTMLAYMYEQAGDFLVRDSLDDVAEKLVRRHPHVFGETEGFEGPGSTAKTDTAEKVLAQWELIKRGVEGRKADSVLDEVSRGMPALERAHKLQKKAAKSGFDWAKLDDVWPKVDEELAELREAVAHKAALADLAANGGVAAGGDRETALEAAHSHIEDELGDLLFAVVNIARHLKVDPGVAITRTNAKFTRRFRHVEAAMKAAGIPMDKAHLADMDRFWDEAKTKE